MMKTLRHALFFLFCFFSFSLAQAQTNFSYVSQSAGINHLFNVGDFHFGGGMCVFDFDNDGDEDIYMVGGTNPDHFYRNNGNATFTDIRSTAGILMPDTYLTTGCSAADIDNDGDRDLFITTRCLDTALNVYVPNLLYLNNGNGTFTDISASSGIANDTAFSNSVTFGDVNQDGYIDIYVGNYFETPVYSFFDTTGMMDSGMVVFNGMGNFLYINNGNNTFTETGANALVNNTGCAWQPVLSDYDNDNDPDIYIANDFGTMTGGNAWYRNNYPNAVFTDFSATSGADVQILSMGVGIGDYDEDGWLDYYATNAMEKYLFHNNGNGTFTDMAVPAEVDEPVLTMPNSGLSCFNYVPNAAFTGNDTVAYQICDTAAGSPCDTVYVVYQVGNTASLMDSVSIPYIFIKCLHDSSVNRCPVDIGGSGDTTLVAPVTSPANGMLNPNDTYNMMAISWGAVFFDYDNDTWLDLYVGNGTLTPFVLGDLAFNPNSLFHNEGNGTFSNTSVSAGLDDKWITRGVISFDYDNDGDLDVGVLNQQYKPGFAPTLNPNSGLYRNDSASGNWLKVKLQGTWTNRDGIGCHIRVVAGGRSFMREIDGGSSLASQNSIIAHFGLGSFTQADTVEVTWRGGFKQVLVNQNANQLLTIVESNPNGLNDPFSESLRVYPNPFSDRVMVDVRCAEQTEFFITVRDISGRQILAESRFASPGVNNFEIKFGDYLTKGFYFVTVSNGKEESSFKLIRL